MTTVQPYTIPIIAGDLRRAELVKQFAETCDYLDSVSQDMFNRIAIRLNVYRAQLNKFDERIQHATAHIERIKGSKRAIQVHSSARYPVEQNRSTYKSIFEYEMESEENKPPVLHFNAFRLNETVDKFIDPNEKTSKTNDDTLVVLKQYENNFIQKTKRNVLTGLGKPPTNLKSVVSFLKYNTQENPYTQPTKIDPLNIGGRMRKQAEPAGPRISEAPAPAFYKQTSERPVLVDFGYNPAVVFLPELALPDNLPELGNFATFDDSTTLSWTKEQATSIAPSFAISMLPDINDTSSPTTTPAAAVVEPPKPAAPAPPPVNMPAIIPLISTPASVPPPPPPPPPPAPALPAELPSVLSPPSAETQSQALATSQPAPAGGGDDDDDGGNPLLAAIRNFGKNNKLKSVSKQDPLDDAPAAPAKGQESMMDALKARLGKRRALIAGENADSSGAKKPAAPAAPTPPPATGGAFTDAIAQKAKEIADEKRQNDSDASDSSESEWEE